MLCIALLAFVVIEESSPAHAAADNAQAGIGYAITNVEGAAAETAGDDQETPGTPAQPQHHCCAAHCGGMTAAVGGATLMVQASVRTPTPRDVQGTPDNAPEGLERPPKATAIV